MDVQAALAEGVGFAGWIVRKREEGKVGKIVYWSKDGAAEAGDMSLAPTLIVTLSDVPEEDLDGDGYTVSQGDCDDSNASVNPAASETCNEIDDNCDGAVDEGVTLTFYADGDGDGYGVSTDTVQSCTAPSGYSSLTGDCNEADPGVNPGASEICDGVDNNCDGITDPGCLTGIIADPVSFNLSGAGAVQQLTVTGYYYDGSSADLTSSATGTVYTSADLGIATVGIDGFVTAVSSGNTTVTATNLGQSSVVNVTVSILPPNYQPSLKVHLGPPMETWYRLT